MRILHIAPSNTAGVPMTFVKAERTLGHESRLITLSRSSQSRDEDICLDLPFLDFWGTHWIKKVVTPKQRRVVSYIAQIPHTIPIQWRPGNVAEKALIQFREKVWSKKIPKTLQHRSFSIFLSTEEKLHPKRRIQIRHSRCR